MMPQNRLVVLSQGHTGVCTQDSECQIQNRAGDADGIRDLNLEMVLHCACINHTMSFKKSILIITWNKAYASNLCLEER